MVLANLSQPLPTNNPNDQGPGPGAGFIAGRGNFQVIGGPR